MTASISPARRASKLPTPKPARLAVVEPAVKEIGGRAVYDLRSHPRKAPWEMAADETRAAYRARFQEIVNALAVEGYVIRRR